MNKNKLRQQMRLRRRSLSNHERREAAHGLCQVFSHSSIFRRSRRIALYFANDGELDPQPLLSTAWRQGKQAYLPVVHGPMFNRMWFAPYRQDDPLKTNRYGIAEPAKAAANMMLGQYLDLVLMPLVAFDGQGNRLGMGGGYFDRSFAYLRHRRIWRKPLLLGVGYDFQRLDSLPHDPWDVPMDGVVTESHLMLFK